MSDLRSRGIENRDEALKTIKATSAAFFVAAALQVGLGVLMAAQYPDAGFDFGDLAISGLLYFAFASWLRWGRSRFAAIIRKRHEPPTWASRD